MRYAIPQIAEILDTTIPPQKEERIVTQLLTDSRQLFQANETLFVALKTDRQDGHRYIQELYQKGVRAFLVHQQYAPTAFPEAVFLKVPHPLKALQQLVTAWRNQYSLPVIGITGSNGKTIIKEWLYQLLSPEFNIVKSPKSYNSQTGVPLSVAEMNPTHQLGIFEAGISQPQEMERLEKIIQPQWGIFTNIGKAHAEGFVDIREKIKEKLKLFARTELLVFQENNSILTQEILQFKEERLQEGKPIHFFSWSRKKESGASLIITQIQQKPSQQKTFIRAEYQGKKTSITIPFTDEGSIENAIHCWCILLFLKIPFPQIVKRMRQLQPVAMRLEMKPGIQHCLLINDSYNADFESIKVALDFLIHQKQKGLHTFILSDVDQTGLEEKEFYQKIAHLIQTKKIDRFIGIGEAITKQAYVFKNIPQTSFYASTEVFLKKLNENMANGLYPFQEEIILLKGARRFTFEKISKRLEQRKHQNVLKINLNAVAHNLKTYQALLKPSTKTMVIVKAFSYGSGSAEIAGLLQYHQVDYLAVANIDEGIFLRKNGITLPILILNPDLFYFDDLIHWNLEPEIYSSALFQNFQKRIAALGIANYPIHLKLDTGMHRLGFSKEEIGSLTESLQKQHALKVVSIFSHLSASEDPAFDTFTQNQSKLFEQMSEQIMEVLPYPVIRHLANTSGISRHAHLQFDMVRLGIGLYGIDPAIQDKLEIVHTLKATIVQIKELLAGETIGYGRAEKLNTPKRIAIVSIGYADGYLRQLGLGKAKMLLHHKQAPTIGRVCMDLLMLDITHIPEAKEGDTVTVFGEQPRLMDIATRINTIPGEILSGLSKRIIRIYTQE